MNFAPLVRALGRIPIISRILRWSARQYREGSVVTIPTGHARGLRWKRSKRYVNGYWLGQYEFPVQEALIRELASGNTFYDIGANAGFFTLVAAKRVGSNGRCIAFDPDPFNAETIRTQAALNRYDQIEVVQVAVSDLVGPVTFTRNAPGDSKGRIGALGPADESLTVTATTLDEVGSRFGAAALIKIDVEGAEGAVLRGGCQFIESCRPTLLIEVHGSESWREVRAALDAVSYRFYSLSGQSIDDVVSPSWPSHVIAEGDGLHPRRPSSGSS